METSALVSPEQSELSQPEFAQELPGVEPLPAPQRRRRRRSKPTVARRLKRLAAIMIPFVMLCGLAVLAVGTIRVVERGAAGAAAKRDTRQVQEQQAQAESLVRSAPGEQIYRLGPVPDNFSAKQEAMSILAAGPESAKRRFINSAPVSSPGAMNMEQILDWDVIQDSQRQ